MFSNKKIAVAMSGGVDSSYVAMFYKEAGAEVFGITGLMTSDEASLEVVKNSKAVCDFLGIGHYVVDLSDSFEKDVIDYFKNSYQQGLTPNPCVVCNRKIKWGKLKDFAMNSLGADFFATGHYAKLQKEADGYKLYHAKDEKKDQLYVLCCLTQEDFDRTLFPMGDIDKNTAKQACLEKNLPCKNSKESQDICFIPRPDTTKKFLIRALGEKEGDFVDINTKKIRGKHSGFYLYTTGQRKGIGLSNPEPLYVTGTDACRNIVYVGLKNNLYTDSLEICDVNIQQERYKNSEFRAMVKVRYNTTPKPARVITTGNTAKIFFDEPESSITPGQACAIYDEKNTFLIGGGWICKKI